MVPNGWIATQFGELADFRSGGTPSKQNAAYWGGEEPWISGKDLKSHYLHKSIDKLSTEGFNIAKKAPLGSSLILVRGMTLLKDFPVGYATREVAFNQDIKALLAKANVDGLFLSFLLAGNKHKIKNLVTTAGHGTGRLDTDSLKEFPVDLPPLPEQRKIAQILSIWDRGIATTEKLIDASKQQKKALMQQLLTGKKRLVDPETGKEFEGEWKEVRVSTLLSVRKEKLIPSAKVPLFSLTIEKGVTPKTERYDREFLVKNSDNKKYKVVYPQDIVYNPANLRWGAINYSRISHAVVVSPIYEVLYVSDFTKTSLEFVAQKLMSSTQINRFATMVEGTLMERKSVKIEPFLATKIFVPQAIIEQQRIADILSTADKEIELLETKLEHLKQEKKALMQQLLTGKRRVSLSS
ncbi:restriction endonuclease subunit S [Vibrio parahaemolyticus]|nr:restriction endonuclease subunit S [Vibrio parahaemolyticus]MDF5522599.1 restriction endonuclease subunit S [Vibrio parahaemolyticus]HBC3540240.1 restriction endonuclease subunit S [Vibrio parahaemolyticus]HBC3816581.1 restriction endonuclease subunit S [Vibrio parahaemolyticus]